MFLNPKSMRRGHRMSLSTDNGREGAMDVGGWMLEVRGWMMGVLFWRK